MKSELMALFGDQLRWFIHLNWKQRLCVLYFCLNFCLIFSVSEDNLLWALFVVLNFVEKPLNFDPFGHAELSLFAKI